MSHSSEKNKRKRRYCSNLQLTVQYIGRLFLITLTYILSDSAVWSKTAIPATFEVLHITSYLSLIIYVVNFAKTKKRISSYRTCHTRPKNKRKRAWHVFPLLSKHRRPRLTIYRSYVHLYSLS